MSADVIKLVTELGDGSVIPAEQILAEAAGKYRSLVLVGETHGGELQVCGSHGAADSLMNLAWAQAFRVENRVVR